MLLVQLIGLHCERMKDAWLSAIVNISPFLKVVTSESNDVAQHTLCGLINSGKLDSLECLALGRNSTGHVYSAVLESLLDKGKDGTYNARSLKRIIEPFSIGLTDDERTVLQKRQSQISRLRDQRKISFHRTAFKSLFNFVCKKSGVLPACISALSVTL